MFLSFRDSRQRYFHSLNLFSFLFSYHTRALLPHIVPFPNPAYISVNWLSILLLYSVAYANAL